MNFFVGAILIAILLIVLHRVGAGYRIIVPTQKVKREPAIDPWMKNIASRDTRLDRTERNRQLNIDDAQSYTDYTSTRLKKLEIK